MIRAFRRTSLASVFTAIALVATMPVTISSLLHDASDDTFCDPAIVVHDQDAHRFSAPGPAPQESQHCVLCHTLQALRAVQSSARFIPALADVGRLLSASAVPVQSRYSTSQPARAPPLA